MGITNLVPYNEAEIAILEELTQSGGEGETGIIVDNAKKHFPVLQTPTEEDRMTPSGNGWWSGRFRFDLSRLKRKNEVINTRHGLWIITEKGISRLEKTGRVVPENVKKTIDEKSNKFRGASTSQPKNTVQVQQPSGQNVTDNATSVTNSVSEIIDESCKIKELIPSLTQQQKIALKRLLSHVQQLFQDLQDSI